jgi:hypothetical protein
VDFFPHIWQLQSRKIHKKKKSDPDPHQTEPPAVGTLEEAAAVVTAPNLKPPDSPKLGATILKQNTSIIGDQD